jgi:putative salt-induced outer membrane protein YdiY
MLYARGTKAEENHQETENETLGGVDFERTFRDRHLWYARGEIEQDDIEGLDLRTTTAGGYGYYFVKEPTQSLRGRVGLQYRHERYDTGLTEDTLAPEFGLRYEAALRTWAKLVSEVTYAPAFDRPSDYRLDHTTAVDIPLAAAKRWALRLGVTNSYNSIAVEDHDKLETLYLARLVLKLP